MENNFCQIFVKLLENKTLALQFPTQHRSEQLTAQSIKQRIETLTLIPSHIQKLTLNGKFLNDDSRISSSISPPTVTLTFSLLGGKGGFGSLLRGAATKAGQKKTNNFDACRDMSGRRLRHVNAEKRMEEWRAEEEERRMEKVAEEYIKKMAKAKKKEGGGDGAKKYIEKYREESLKCVEEVVRSVEESIGELMGGKKRKLMEKLKGKAADEGVDAKKLKIWMGKRLLGESDSDDSDEDNGSDDLENEKSVVIDNGVHSDSGKDACSGSVSVGQSDGECCGGVTTDSGSDEEKGTVTGGSGGSDGSPSGSNDHVKGNVIALSEIEVKMDQNGTAAEVVSSEEDIVSERRAPEAVTEVHHKSTPVLESNLIPESTAEGRDEKVNVNMNESEVVQPLNLDDFNSSAELEVLGMERLKSELQARGLKCGGTLQERAARLFLLKTTPLDKLPKKLFAKK